MKRSVVIHHGTVWWRSLRATSRVLSQFFVQAIVAAVTH
jgi:hypothetical protein